MTAGRAGKTRKPRPGAVIPAARWLPQVAVLVVVVVGATLRNSGIVTSWTGRLFPELRALCPFGAVQAVTGFLSAPAAALGDLDRLLVPAGVILSALILGPVFCSRLCPLGTIQEWIGLLGRRVLGKRYNRPVRGDQFLRYGRYLLLAGVAATALGFIAIETDLINPSLALVHVWSSVVPVSALVLLVVVGVTSFFVERPWCRWLCPYGALLGTVGRIAPWTIRRNPTTCINCGLCDRACPLAIGISTVSAVRDDRCNRCERCITACPVEGAVALRTGGASANGASANGASANGASANGTSANGASAAARVSAAAVLLFVTPLLLVRAFDLAGSGSVQAPTGEIVSVVEDRIVADTGLLTPERITPDRITPMMTLRTLAEEAQLSLEELGELLQLPERWQEKIDPEFMLIDLEEEPGLEHVTVGYIRTVFGELGK